MTRSFGRRRYVRVRPGLAADPARLWRRRFHRAALDAIEEAFLAASRAARGRRNFRTGRLPRFRRRSSVGSDGADQGRHRAAQSSAADLLGEISRDALGLPVLLPGHLMRAGSGIVIVEAWRLAADPAAWLALSAAIRSKQIVPVGAPGIGIKVDPIPLAATIVLVSDAQSWSKLEAHRARHRAAFPARCEARRHGADVGTQRRRFREGRGAACRRSRAPADQSGRRAAHLQGCGPPRRRACLARGHHAAAPAAGSRCRRVPIIRPRRSALPILTRRWRVAPMATRRDRARGRGFGIEWARRPVARSRSRLSRVATRSARPARRRLRRRNRDGRHRRTRAAI